MKTMSALKTLIVAAAATTSLTARAGQSDTIASYGLYLGMNGGHVSTAQVTLDGEGRLVIEKTVLGQPVITSTISTIVAPATLELLKTKIEQLSTAEVQTTQSQIVCMMMPVWGTTDRVLKVRRDYDYSTDTFTGALAVIDNNAGCWAHTHIAPKNAYDLATAQQLESQLEVLTSEAVANQ